MRTKALRRARGPGNSVGNRSDHHGKTPRSPTAKGRRYPRGPHEAGGLETIGNRRALGLARVGYLVDGMRSLEEAAVEDKGGYDEIPVLELESLRIGIALESIGVLLLAEIQDKARRSRAAGCVPHASRYKATQMIVSHFDAAARRYERVGLSRRTKAVERLTDYLQQKGRMEDAT